MNPTTQKPFGPYGLPAVVLAYGRSKIGKTTDAVYSFPTALFCAMPGALKSAIGVVGLDRSQMAVVNPRTIPEAAKFIHEAAGTGRFTAVVVDDFSLLAQATLSALESRGCSGFAAWGALRDAVLEFRDVARAAGMHVILNAHERGADTINGVYRAGGPKLPSKNLTDEIPVIADMVLRASIDPMRKPWPGVYQCDPTDTTIITGDRHNIAPKKGPMNIAELLRAAGYPIARMPGLEWQEEIAEIGAEGILAGKSKLEVLKKFAAFCDEQGYNPLHRNWALRDMLDRATLRKSQSSHGLEAFGISPRT